MNSIVVSLGVTACVFAGGMIGLHMHRIVPKDNLTKETQDVIRLGTGMLSVLASLVLGLLISTAKTSSDSTDHAMRTFSAGLILLDETLRDYGDAAKVPRDLLRNYTSRALADHWPTDGQAAKIDNAATGNLLERVREQIRALKPVDDGQRGLQGEALKINSSLLQQRWLLIEEEGPSVKPLVLAILVSWIFFIFASFGLNAPRNSTVVAAFLVCSAAIGGSVFLIMELDSPFSGVLRISSEPMRNALAHMTTGAGLQ